VSLIVVTGASGHVGANLVRALIARGEPVRALVHRDRRALDGLQVELAYGDVTDRDSLRQAFEGAKVVYNAAGYISISAHEWQRLEAVNVLGVRHVVDACLQCGVSRLVHISSIEALVDEPATLPIDESRPLVTSRRYPPYPRSKAAGEMEVRQGVARGLDAVVLNPTAIIGPHDYRLGYANAGLLAIRNGQLPVLVNGGFDWVDVRDVTQGAIEAAARAPCGSRYILSGHQASLHTLAKLVEEISGSRRPRIVVPMWLARPGVSLLTIWNGLTGRRSLYTPAALRPLRSNSQISHARATRDLGYRPRPLKESVADTLAWLKSRQ
jgi:dihydroflavonol-4-reductase